MELLKSRTGRVLIESHRGAEALAPENSWPALEAGRQGGADLLEMDVQLSSDGVAFLRHHYTLPDGRWFSSLPASELKQIRIEGEPLPVLEDVLAWAREQDTCLSLDLKVGFTPERALVKQVLRLIQHTQMQANVLLLCWDHQELLQIKREHPVILTRALLHGRVVDLAGLLKAAQADSVSLAYGTVRPSDVEEAHRAGAAVMLGEMWNPDFEIVKQWGFDLISWSDPYTARQMLENN